MIEKMKMQTRDGVADNISWIAEKFPNCVTEKIDATTGEVKMAVDFDMLRQELSSEVVEGKDERYQFVWPDKKKAILLANAPVNATLRPCEEESEDFANTQNLYIEGDNLDVLKCLKETYLGKVKMIYIDPPYNTGNDFVYNDDFAESMEDYLANSGQYDEQGNRLVANTESNGRFHTDWLNMMYPRLKVAKELLCKEGAIFISIDDNEQRNLKIMCDEILGANNFVAYIPWRKRTAKSDVPFGVSQDYEWILIYAKSSMFVASVEGKERKYYTTDDFPNKPWRVHDLTKQTTASERPKSFFTIVNPKNGKEYPANPNRTWAITEDTFQMYYKEDRIVFPGDYDFLNIAKPVLRYWKEDDMNKAGDSFGRVAVSTKLPDEIGMSQDGTKEVTGIFNGKIFSFPKPTSLIKHFLNIINDKDALVLDFFSGSATTAHAVMQLNAEDGGNRKYIMVQVPEKTDNDSEAFKAGYKTICEIGKERIRRAAKRIKEETGADIDYGFRVLKLDSTNMEDVYYAPAEVNQDQMSLFAENVKYGRTGKDLLFQAMLELGATLDSKIEETKINGKVIYNVADGYLVACFDTEVTDDVVKAIAQMQPLYAVLRDSSLADDSTATNFEQIFKSYSPTTTCKIL
jgi:adenine-specific DNA-methyltransferase